MNKLTDVASIIISIFGVGALLAALILTGQSGIKGDMYGIKDDMNGIRADMNEIRADVADLQQRTARMEGQLALLIDAWDIEMPTFPAVADR